MKNLCSSCKQRPKQNRRPCQSCKRAYMAKWRKKNRIAVRLYQKKWAEDNKELVSFYRKDWNLRNRHRRRDFNVRSKYGIRYNDVKKIFRSQNRQCAGCLRKLTLDTINVDHCHKSSKVRGLLCHQCNISLGLMKDNPIAIRNLAKYAAKHKK